MRGIFKVDPSSELVSRTKGDGDLVGKEGESSGVERVVSAIGEKAATSTGGV